MKYQHAQAVLYDALKARKLDTEAEKGTEKYLNPKSTLPIHGTTDSPLTTTRVRMILRTLGKSHNLSGLNLSGVSEARTFSQLTAILANSTQNPRTNEDVQYEAALAYLDFPLAHKSSTTQPDDYLTKIKVRVPRTRQGYPIGPLEEEDLRALEEVGLTKKD